MKRQWFGPGLLVIIFLLIGLWYFAKFTCDGPESDPVLSRPALDSSAWISQRADTFAGPRIFGGCLQCGNRNELGFVTKDTIFKSMWHTHLADGKYDVKMQGLDHNTIFDWCEEINPCPKGIK
jgi:hypothetical protein